MTKKTINIAMIGGGFMGKAHSNAWLRVAEFFDVPFRPVLKVVAGSKNNLDDFADRWGYEEITYDWRTVLDRDDIDVIDIGSPPYLHKEMVIEAAKAGKHIVCEKPFSLSYTDAKDMLEAAQKAGVVHYLNHNYRRIPAVVFAKQLIDDGRIGRIYHWRGAYLQDWVTDPHFPLTWHMRKELAGGGPLFDLSTHAMDLARYLIGEPSAVSSVNRTFITERPLPGEGAATFSAGSGVDLSRTGPVTVDDASFSIVEFECGALGSVETTRLATGCKNVNTFEIYGSNGSIKFNLEDMNELQFLDASLPATEQGFRRILVTEDQHPYLKAWWPTGHIIGYEHTFVNAFRDFLMAVDGKEPIKPDFHDGVQILRIVEAMRKSGEEQRRVSLSEIE